MKKIFLRPESLLLIFLIIITNSFVWQKDNWQRNVLSTDGRGYYAYLPAAFIYQDLTYHSNSKAIEEELGYEMSHHYILTDAEGNTFNKTFPGVAICLAPLFLLATFLSFLFGAEVNGYSEIFLLGIQFSAISACILGYHFLKKLLVLKKTNLSFAKVIPFIGIFATNIYYYACNGSSMSHIYSFMMMAIFLYAVQQIIGNNGTKHYITAAVALALIFLLRPTNVLIIFLIPFLAGSKDNFISLISNFLKDKKKLMLTLFSGILVLGILPVLWFLQTGHFAVWSYTGEGFNFTKPLMHKVLFSFRNGMFIYSPFALLLFAGLVVSFKKNKFAGTFAGLFFLINLYIISSWWTFHYGGGFGHRAMAEHHVFSILMIGIIVQVITLKWKQLFFALSTLLIGLSVFQGFQTVKGILPSDYVNAEMYRLLFLKWDDKYIGECNATLDVKQFGEVRKINYIRPIKFDQEPVLYFDENREFGGDAEFIVPEIDEYTQLYLDFNYKKKRISETPFNEVMLIVEGVDKNGKSNFYRSSNLYQIRSEALNEFKQLQIGLQLEKLEYSKLKFYIWNKGRQTFTLEDIDIRILMIKP